jgi:hypothetical protein
MKLILIIAGLLVAATSMASAQGQRYSMPYAYGGGVPYAYGGVAPTGGYGQNIAARFTPINAPGGAYIDCDPRNPQSPIRCTPDGW